MNWKVLIVLSVLLVASNVFWLFKITDSSVTLTYQSESLSSQKKSLTVLQKVVPALAKDYEKAQLLDLIKRLSLENHYILDKEGVVSIDDVGFVFESNKLVSIEYY